MLSPLWLSILLSTLSLLFFANSNNLEHFFLIQLLKTTRGDDLLMVLFGEQQAGFLQSLAVEIVCVLKDLADGVDRNVLGEDVLALPLN